MLFCVPLPPVKQNIANEAHRQTDITDSLTFHRIEYHRAFARTNRCGYRGASGCSRLYRRHCGSLPHPAASAYQASGLPHYPPHGRSQGNGDALFPHLHMGRSCHVRIIRALRMVYRHAELAHSHVHSHYTEHREHHRQPQPCLFLQYEGRRRSLGDADRPIRGLLHGTHTVDEPLR